MKHTILLCLCLALCISVMAQKIKTTNEELKFSYMRVPTDPLEEDMVTYSRSIVAGAKVGNYANTANYLDYLKIQGKTLVNDGGHLLLEITVGDPVFYVNKVEKETYTTEKDGKKTTHTAYQPKLDMGLAISYRLIDYNGLELINKEFQSAASHSLISIKEVSSQSEAEKKLTQTITNKIQTEIQDAVLIISESVSKKYGYSTIQREEKILGVKPDDHPAYAKFQKALSGVQKAFAQVKPGTDIKAIKASVADHISYWEQTEKTVDAEDKKEVMLKYACLYNLARTHIWLEDVSAAQAAFAKLEEVDKKGFEVSQLGDDIKAISELIARSGDKGLYYAYTVPDVAPPSDVKYAMTKSAPASLNTSSIQVTSSQEIRTGKVFYGGKERDAAFVLPVVKVEGGPLNFQPDDGFKIYEHTGGSFEELLIPLTLRPGDYYTMDDVKYVVSRAEKGKYYDVTEIYYESDRIKFYALNSMNSKSMFPKFRVSKAGSETPWEPKGISEAEWKRTLKEYLSDCPEVAAVIDKGSMNEEEYMPAVCAYYTKSCK